MQDTLDAAREALGDPESYTVLLTGRWEAIFGSRVRELLDQVGLDFAEVYCAETPDTQGDKILQINRILQEMPSIQLVEMWEDRAGQVQRFQEAVQGAGRAFKMHLVQELPGTAFRVAARWCINKGRFTRG